MNEKTSFIKCPKCKSDAFKIYDVEEIKKQYSDDMHMRVLMLRQYQCSKETCKHIFAASLFDVTKAFIQLRLSQGKTGNDIKEELKDQYKK